MRCASPQNSIRRMPLVPMLHVPLKALVCSGFPAGFHLLLGFSPFTARTSNSAAAPSWRRPAAWAIGRSGLGWWRTGRGTGRGGVGAWGVRKACGRWQEAGRIDYRARTRGDHPVLDHQPPVRHLGQFLVVRYDHEGLAELLAQVEEELVQFAGMGAVEVAAGLIGQHHARVVEERTGHGHPLLLAAAQLARLVLGTCRQCSGASKQFFGARAHGP